MQVQPATETATRPAPFELRDVNVSEQPGQVRRLHINGEPVALARVDGQWVATLGHCGVVFLRASTQLEVLADVARLLTHDAPYCAG